MPNDRANRDALLFTLVRNKNWRLVCSMLDDPDEDHSTCDNPECDQLFQKIGKVADFNIHEIFLYYFLEKAKEHKAIFLEKEITGMLFQKYDDLCVEIERKKFQLDKYLLIKLIFLLHVENDIVFKKFYCVIAALPDNKILGVSILKVFLYLLDRHHKKNKNAFFIKKTQQLIVLSFEAMSIEACNQVSQEFEHYFFSESCKALLNEAHRSESNTDNAEKSSLVLSIEKQIENRMEKVSDEQKDYSAFSLYVLKLIMLLLDPENKLNLTQVIIYNWRFSPSIYQYKNNISALCKNVKISGFSNHIKLLTNKKFIVSDEEFFMALFKL